MEDQDWIPETIYVDDREPAWVIDTLRFLCSTPEFDRFTIVVERLDRGDFIYRDLIVERKLMSDFHASIIDARIWEQAEKMWEEYEHALILASEDKKRKLTLRQSRACRTAAVDIYFRFGIPTFFVDSDEALCVLFLKICVKHAKDLKPRAPIKREKRSKGNEQLQILMSFPEVGRDRAIKLLMEYGSISEVINAVLDDKKAVADNITGVGMKTVDSIHKYATESWGDSGAS